MTVPNHLRCQVPVQGCNGPAPCTRAVGHSADHSIECTTPRRDPHRHYQTQAEVLD